MAIETIINLGIKGSELVTSQLKKIQNQKENLSKKTDVTLGSRLQQRREERKTEKEQGIRFQTKTEREFHKQKNEPVPTKPISPEKESKPSQYGQDVKSGLANARSQAANSVLSMNGTGIAQAGIGAVTALIPVVGQAVGQAINFAIDAMRAFKEKIKQQASIVADTQAQINTITNSFKKESQNKSFEDLIGFDVGNGKRKGRTDLTKADQAGIVNAITSSMGKISDDFGKSVSDLFISKDGQKKFDVGQSTALAQGNFSALGTDKGFFMQQISSGFTGLPPSMKQKLTSQMFGMLDDTERDLQNDYGIKSVQTGFDNQARNKAASGLGEGIQQEKNIMNANRIQGIEDQLDLALQKVVAKATDKVANIAYSKDPLQAIKNEAGEAVKLAAQGAATAINTMKDSVVSSMKETTDSVKSSLMETANSVKGVFKGLTGNR